MSEWKDHADVLRDFMSAGHRTIGTNSIHSIERIKDAIHYFARDDGLGKLLTELEQTDNRLAAAERLAALVKQYGSEFDAPVQDYNLRASLRTRMRDALRAFEEARDA